jgi:adhesin/invasin
LAAAKKSTLEASSYGVNTNDTTTSTITMQAKDANGNNLTTGGLTVTMSVNGSATLSSVSDNAVVFV